MKKILALLIAAMMLFCFVACDTGDDPNPNKDNPGTSQGGENNNGGASNNGNGDPIISDEDVEDFEDAMDKLEGLMPEGWDENRYGAYIYDVWDQEFLPDCFPAPPEGVKVDQTTFKDYKHDTLNGSYAVGPLYYESKEDYREYGVFFYATEDQLNTFTEAVEAKGMVGGCTETGEWTYYDYFGNGWFMEIFVRESISEEAYDYSVSVSATDSLFTLPEFIDGIPLPQCGMTECDYNKGYTIQDFTYGYDDVDFDLSKDKLPDEYYAAWFNYHCATNQDAIDYAHQLKDLGWEVEWETNGEDGYRCCLKKDGIYAISNYYAYDCLLEVGFSDMVENLTY